MKVQYYDVSYDKYTHFKMHDPYTVNVVLKLFEFRYKLDKKCFLSKIHFTVKCHEKFSSTSCSTRIVPIN